MSLATEERNKRIRRKYARLYKEYKKRKERNASDKAITDLVRQFSAWHLEFETIKKIIFDKNYGKRQEKDEKDENILPPVSAIDTQTTLNDVEEPKISE